MFFNTYLNQTLPLNHIQQKPPIVRYAEWCAKQKPKSVFCELPDDFKSLANSGTPTYTITFPSGASIGFGTSTTTT